MKPNNFNKEPKNIIKLNNKNVYCFSDDRLANNIDETVVDSFGKEWEKFNKFSDKEIKKIGDLYFDIIDDKIVNKSSYGIDIGCGTGRWSKYLSKKIGFLECVDPSSAIFTATKLLKNTDNVRFSKASADNLPFDDKIFDFGMSIGVLHHIPDTAKALNDCVKKIKKGGYFYLYLYYNFENKGILFKILFHCSTIIRLLVSRFPTKIKMFMCDLIALFIYMPFILIGRFFLLFNLKKIANIIPLNIYQKTSFYVIRNDALDRFGTTLEQRFSKKNITNMMISAGLDEIKISKSLPYWHAIGRKIK